MTPDSIRLGIIGLGARGLRSIGGAVAKAGGPAGVRIAAVHDTHPVRLAEGVEHLRRLCRANGLSGEIAAYGTEEALMADPAVDVVVIANPQDQHEASFLNACASGKPIYCEKPLSASPESCAMMRRAWELYRPRCMIGLTRRYENVWLKAAELTATGVIGTAQLMLLRSVIPYSRYFGGWWRQRSRSGDLLNEKSSHHFDVLNWMSGSTPRSVYALGGRNVFLPRAGYPDRCSDCRRECAYRRPERGRQDYTDTFQMTYPDDPGNRLVRDLCVYSEEADILDHAIVSLDYASGLKASLFFSVFGADVDDQETLEIVGDSGRILLTRQTGTLDVISRNGRERATYDCRGPYADESHFGADRNLIGQLGAFGRGADPAAGFIDAYRASMIAFNAQESIRDGGERDLTTAAE